MNEEIERLTRTPTVESPTEQRARCARWAMLAYARLSASGVTAFEMAVATEREPHWWRDLSFVLTDRPIA